MRAIIKYYMKGKRNAIIKYVDDYKFEGLIDIASDCPFDPDHLARFYIVADFNKPSKKTLEEDKNIEVNSKQTTLDDYL